MYGQPHSVFLSCNSAVFVCRTYIVLLRCLYHYRFLILCQIFCCFLFLFLLCLCYCYCLCGCGRRLCQVWAPQLYQARGKQPHIHQLPQYHSNHTTFVQHFSSTEFYIKTPEMNIRQLKLEKMCLYGFISNFYRFDLNGSISYVHSIRVNISESLQILM